LTLTRGEEALPQWPGSSHALARREGAAMKQNDTGELPLRLDRRDIIRGALAGTLSAGWSASPARAISARPRLFIYDGRFLAARRGALQCRSQNIATLDTQDTDLGLAWTTFLRSQTRGGTALSGLTRWMDSYVCESFGRECGLRMRRSADSREQDLYSWQLI
jgi:hypothetical protein